MEERDFVNKALLKPVSWLYGLGVRARNYLYDKGVLEGVKFDLPILSVGNLSAGGTGKTPHVEYLIRLLMPYIKVATLSRGYKRKKKGFNLVEMHSTAKDVGDEPLLFKRKYPNIQVAVSEDRTFAVPRMLMAEPDLKAILLDDAFQHRGISPGHQILLTTYDMPYTKDELLPAGRLREPIGGASRADTIVVTKCPPDLSEVEAEEMKKSLAPNTFQKVFFSTYDYLNMYYYFNPSYRMELSKDWDVLLVSGIAAPDFLVKYVDANSKSVVSLEFGDHHFFEDEDITKIKNTYDAIKSERKLIITTEKDAVRMDKYSSFFQKEKIPLFILPVAVKFLFEEGPQFNDRVIQFLMNFKI